MNRYFPTLFTIATMFSVSLHASGTSNSTGHVGEGAVSQFQIAEKTQIPGHTLKPGSYTIAVLDRLSDRMVVRITSDAGKEESTFLAVSPTVAFPGQVAPGPVHMFRKGGHAAALRGYVFADGTRSEFVYRKAEAVPLAKENSTTVVAVDPESEGRPDKDDLSPTDRQLVALWMLTPTVVGKSPAVEAQRYQAAADNLPLAAQHQNRSTNPAGNDLVASNFAPPRPHRVANRVAVLPHTASSRPIVVMLGLFSAIAASLLTLRRRAGAPAL